MASPSFPRYLLALLLLALPGWGQTMRTEVLPSRTDPAIRGFNGPHSVFYNPRAPARPELLVFLPGTGGGTHGVDAFCTTAAELGYHVLNLQYPDSLSASVCRDEADARSFGLFRRAVCEGGSSRYISISRANSIENRLLKLLAYLQATRPQEGWGQYLRPGPDPAAPALAWERLALAGQSQGGGHAAWLAGRHPVARVLLFSSPKDWSRATGRPAPWYTAATQTPPDHYFAFVHAQDRQACTPAQQVRIFQALRLGPPQTVDGQRPPFGQAHALLTNYPGQPLTSQQAHLLEVTDGGTPRQPDGTPLFRPVWEYMLTAR